VLIIGDADNRDGSSSVSDVRIPARCSNRSACAAAITAEPIPSNNSFLLHVNLTGLLIASLVAVAAFTYQDVRLVRIRRLQPFAPESFVSADVQNILEAKFESNIGMGYVSLFGEQQFVEWSVLCPPRGSGTSTESQIESANLGILGVWFLKRKI